ncbi:MAG: Hsp20/alpha crystallin family protein [Bacteroidota bacterium]
MTLIKLKQAMGGQAFPGLNNVFDMFDNSIHAGFRNWVTPAVNIRETKDGFQLSLAAPGLKKDDFRIKIEKDQLTIDAEVKEEQEEKDIKYSHREFRFNKFKRVFTIPENLNIDNVQASYENGILILNLPVHELEKSKVRDIVIA